MKSFAISYSTCTRFLIHLIGWSYRLQNSVISPQSRRAVNLADLKESRSSQSDSLMVR